MKDEEPEVDFHPELDPIPMPGFKIDFGAI